MQCDADWNPSSKCISIKYTRRFYNNWNIQPWHYILARKKADWNAFCGISCAEAGRLFFKWKIAPAVVCRLQFTSCFSRFNVPANWQRNYFKALHQWGRVAHRYTRVSDIALQLCTLINGCNNSHRINSPLCFAGHYLHITDPFQPLFGRINFIGTHDTHVAASRGRSMRIYR